MNVLQWIAEINAAKKREKDYRKEGDRILEIYSGKKKDEIPFNILFSNTETLLPANYSAIPRPVVSRRFKDEDPTGKAAATAGQRGLSFLLDTNIDGYETFDDAMKAATLDGLLPGRGVTCVKYDAELGEIPGDVPGDGSPEQAPQEATPYKKSELVCCETRSWNRVYFGYAKKWSKVPWICYEENIDKEEATRLFGAVIANQLKYTVEKDEDEEKKDDEAKGETKTTCILQVWDKTTRKIRWISPARKEGFLKVEDDPLQLTGFFNCPKPLSFIEKANDMMPVAPYRLYENQAEELNKITRRINRIVSAMKAKGIYDSTLGDDIKNLITGDDNTFVPSDKTASIAAENGLQNAIWFWPVDKLILVLSQLLQAREAVKATIFEIMGLADIMRGSSQASETLGAQEIKQQWGGLRLKRTQAEVQRYARDLLRMMLEIAATKFSEETWARMTGLPYLTEEQFRQASQVSQSLQQQLSMVPPPVEGQPPDPRSQQLQQQMQQVQAELQKPKWADVLGMLRDDMQRSYRIDIETNSTVQPEAVEDQKNIADVMNALGQFLNGVTPLVTQGVMPFQAAQSMMLAIVRRFRFGDEIEDYVKQMQPPKPPDDGKAQAEQQKAQMEKQAHDADMQAKQIDAQQKQAENAQKGQLEQQRATLEMEKMRLEADYARADHAYKMAELAAKTQMNEIVSASKIRVAQATAAQKEKQATQPQSAPA